MATVLPLVALVKDNLHKQIKDNYKTLNHHPLSLILFCDCFQPIIIDQKPWNKKKKTIIIVIQNIHSLIFDDSGWRGWMSFLTSGTKESHIFFKERRQLMQPTYVLLSGGKTQERFFHQRPFLDLVGTRIVRRNGDSPHKATSCTSVTEWCLYCYAEGVCVLDSSTTRQWWNWGGRFPRMLLRVSLTRWVDRWPHSIEETR